MTTTGLHLGLSSGLSPMLRNNLSGSMADSTSQRKTGGSLSILCRPVQQQSGSTDCGVFAVAFAYHAVIGDELESISFDKGCMVE